MNKKNGICQFSRARFGILYLCMMGCATASVFRAAQGGVEGPPAISQPSNAEKAGQKEGAVPSAPPSEVAGATKLQPDIASPLLSRGKELFAKQCAICHGDVGNGAGKFAYLMNPRPRNLQQGNFKLVTTQNQIPTDDDLLRTISRGMPGSAMPPWGHLPLSDLRSLVAFVRDVRLQAVQQEAKELMSKGELETTKVDEFVSARTVPGPP
ncbi:MAG: cytochrome c, partial [Planctomycetes bacterium]|nr:cytochrome c [Planctomycetota bacterium]